jgi:hypothetical protein
MATTPMTSSVQAFILGGNSDNYRLRNWPDRPRTQASSGRDMGGVRVWASRLQGPS